MTVAFETEETSSSEVATMSASATVGAMSKTTTMTTKTNGDDGQYKLQDNSWSPWADTNEVNNGHVSDDSDECGDEDIELVVQGKEIVVNEKLLVKYSRYFRMVFCQLDDEEDTVVLRHGKLDGEDDVSEEKQAEPLGLISYATMRTIVDFFQGQGPLCVADQNVKSLLMASDLLVMPSVETECFNFLKANLSVQNCVRRFVLADAKKSWGRLSRHIQHFIRLHFDRLRKQTLLYQQTSVDQFRRLLAGDCLHVSREEQVLDAVREWVEYDEDARRPHLASLLAEVQWPLVREPQTLEALREDPLFAADPAAVKLVNEAIHYHGLSYDEKVAFWNGGDGQNARPRPSRWPKLLAALSYADKMIEYFDFERQSWSVLTEKPTATFGAEMCYLDGKLLALGGVQTKQVDVWDVERGEWAGKGAFPQLTQFRVAHGVATHGSKVLVMGGSAKASEQFGPGLNEMEVLSLEKDDDAKPLEWKMVSAMNVGRSYVASAVSLEDELVYVVGGCLSEDASTAERYDLRSKTWREIARTHNKRDSLGLAWLDGQLFAVGGYDNIQNKYLRTVESYDPDEDAWRPVASMNAARRSPGLVNYRGKLYAVGGMGETEDLQSVEVYDPMSDHWSRLPHPTKEICGWVSCCLVDKPLRLMKSRQEEEDEDVLLVRADDVGSWSASASDSKQKGRRLSLQQQQQQKKRRKSSIAAGVAAAAGTSPSLAVENARTGLRMKQLQREYSSSGTTATKKGGV